MEPARSPIRLDFDARNSRSTLPRVMLHSPRTRLTVKGWHASLLSNAGAPSSRNHQATPPIRVSSAMRPLRVRSAGQGCAGNHDCPKEQRAQAVRRAHAGRSLMRAPILRPVLGACLRLGSGLRRSGKVSKQCSGDRVQLAPKQRDDLAHLHARRTHARHNDITMGGLGMRDEAHWHNAKHTRDEAHRHRHCPAARRSVQASDAIAFWEERIV